MEDGEPLGKLELDGSASWDGISDSDGKREGPVLKVGSASTEGPSEGKTVGAEGDVEGLIEGSSDKDGIPEGEKVVVGPADGISLVVGDDVTDGESDG